MDIFPAIDILAGKVVRASRRGPDQATVYHEDPFAVAEAFVGAGARWLHVVDLDRAFGVGDQSRLVGELVKRQPVPVQVGGGLHTSEAVEEMRDFGVQRVLLHSRVAGHLPQLDAIADQFSGESLGLALDVENGRVWSRDWPDASRWTALELAARARAAGLSVVAFTELKREGALQGSDVEGAAALAREAGVDVIVSGGVDSIDDLKRIREAGLSGAIIGRALYEHRFTIAEAVAC